MRSVRSFSGNLDLAGFFAGPVANIKIMGNGFLLIIAGLLLFYVVISDKFYCLVGAGACLTGKYQSSSPTEGGSFGAPLNPTVPTIGGVLGIASGTGSGSAGLIPR